MRRFIIIDNTRYAIDDISRYFEQQGSLIIEFRYKVSVTIKKSLCSAETFDKVLRKISLMESGNIAQKYECVFDLNDMLKNNIPTRTPTDMTDWWLSPEQSRGTVQ